MRDFIEGVKIKVTFDGLYPSCASDGYPIPITTDDIGTFLHWVEDNPDDVNLRAIVKFEGIAHKVVIPEYVMILA